LFDLDTCLARKIMRHSFDFFIFKNETFCTFQIWSQNLSSTSRSGAFLHLNSKFRQWYTTTKTFAVTAASAATDRLQCSSGCSWKPVFMPCKCAKRCRNRASQCCWGLECDRLISKIQWKEYRLGNSKAYFLSIPVTAGQQPSRAEAITWNFT